MLHPPYTLMVLAFVTIGAALSPRLSWPVLAATLLAYFLGLGIGAHFLDQISGMGSRYVRHWSDRALWSVGLSSVGVAVGLGVLGAGLLLGPGILVFVVLQGIGALGYPLGPVFRGVLHRDSVFALSWGSLPFLTSYYAQAGQLTIGSLLLAGTFGAVAIAEIRVSRLSRQLRREVNESTRGGDLEVAPARGLYRNPDIALQALVVATGLLAFGLLLNRLFPSL